MGERISILHPLTVKTSVMAPCVFHSSDDRWAKRAETDGNHCNNNRADVLFGWHSCPLRVQVDVRLPGSLYLMWWCRVERSWSQVWGEGAWKGELKKAQHVFFFQTFRLWRYSHVIHYAGCRGGMSSNTDRWHTLMKWKCIQSKSWAHRYF